MVIGGFDGLSQRRMASSQYSAVRMSMLALYKDSQITTPAYIQPISAIRRLGMN
jgi:hypothetical protein